MNFSKIRRRLGYLRWLASAEGPSESSNLKRLELSALTLRMLRLGQHHQRCSRNIFLIPTAAIKARIVRRHAEIHNLSTFVETGTFRGDMIAAVARNFARCVTIEISPALHAKAQARLAPLRNVRCLLGDSAQVLEPLIAELTAPALFWLDAHASGGETVNTGSGPVLSELLAIFSGPRFLEHVVLIDDARGHDLKAIQETIPPTHRMATRNDIVRITPTLKKGSDHT